MAHLSLPPTDAAAIGATIDEHPPLFPEWYVFDRQRGQFLSTWSAAEEKSKDFVVAPFNFLEPP
jgi:hypothetical protein